jgi:hypothetical protein
MSDLGHGRVDLSLRSRQKCRHTISTPDALGPSRGVVSPRLPVRPEEPRSPSTLVDFLYSPAEDLLLPLPLPKSDLPPRAKSGHRVPAKHHSYRRHLPLPNQGERLEGRYHLKPYECSLQPHRSSPRVIYPTQSRTVHPPSNRRPIPQRSLPAPLRPTSDSMIVGTHISLQAVDEQRPKGLGPTQRPA